MRRFGRDGSSRWRSSGAAVEVGLQDGADALEPGGAQPLVDPQRPADVVRLLHVDPDERAQLAGARDEPGDVLVRGFLVEGEPEVRELERDVRPQLLRDEALCDPPVLVRDGRGACFVRDRLAEQRRVRVQPRVVQPAQDADALVERLAGDEPPGPEPSAVALDEVLQSFAVGRMQESRARQTRTRWRRGRSRGASLQRVEWLDSRGQFSDGSGGIDASTENGPPLRRSTLLQSPSGSLVKTSSASAGSTIHEPSSSSPSSCPGPQPAYPT